MLVRSKDTITRLLAGKGKVTLGVDAGDGHRRYVTSAADVK